MEHSGEKPDEAKAGEEQARVLMSIDFAFGEPYLPLPTRWRAACVTVVCKPTCGVPRTQVLQEELTMLSRKKEKIAMQVEKCKFKVKT